MAISEQSLKNLSNDALIEKLKCAAVRERRCTAEMLILLSEVDRRKFYAEVAKGTSVALLEPSVAKAFPTSEAVNEALSGLLALTEKTWRITRRSTRTRAKSARTG